jgi:hypothetical protein
MFRKNKKIVVLGVTFVQKNKWLADTIKKISKEKNIDVIVEQDADLIEFIKHGVVLAPGVVVDGKLKSVSRTPTREEIIKWLEELQEISKKTEEKLLQMDNDEYLESIKEEDLNL